MCPQRWAGFQQGEDQSCGLRPVLQGWWEEDELLVQKSNSIFLAR